MAWIIIIVVLLVAIGPVLYILPTRKDKRLAALREQARKRGLNVALTSVTKLDASADERVSAAGTVRDPTRLCASYSLPLRTKLRRFDEFKLLKIPAEPTVNIQPVIDGWVLNSPLDKPGWQVFAASEQMLGRLPDILCTLPDDTLAIGFAPRLLACYWLEQASAESATVDQLAGSLERLGNLLDEVLGQSETDVE